MEKLLAEYGFERTRMLGEFTRGKRYKAIVWGADKATIVLYNVENGRYETNITFESKCDLEEYLKNVFIKS